MTAGEHVGLTAALHPGAELVIGRDPAAAQLVLSGAPEVSRSHAVVLWVHTSTGADESKAITIEDVGSMNGTYGPNGVRLEPGVPVPVSAGDTFHLAHAGIAFRIEWLD